jgi:hypothetical protein
VAFVVKLLYITIFLVVKVMSMCAEDKFAGLRQLWRFEWRTALVHVVSEDYGCTMRRMVPANAANTE